MAAFAVDTQRLSNFLKHEYSPELGFCREMREVTETADTDYDVGTPITFAGGAYRICQPGESVVGFVVGDVLGNAYLFNVKANTPTKVSLLVRGPAMIADRATRWPATFTTPAEKDAASVAIRAAGVLTQTQL
jgi:hypothetical protein